LDALEAVRGGRRGILTRCSEVQGATRTVQLEKRRAQPVGLCLKPRAQAGLPGLEVLSVAADSPAARGGVGAGEVLLMLDGSAVTSPSQVAAMMEGSEGAMALSLAQPGGGGAAAESDTELTNALVFRGDRSDAAADAILREYYTRFAPLQAEAEA